LQHDAEFEQWLSDTFDLVRSVSVELESAREVHWRVLVLNRADVADPDIKRMFDVEDRHSRREEYDKVLGILKSGKPKLLRQADDATGRYYSTICLHKPDFPNWFSTSTGHVGRSYAVPKAGDVVAVFYGASTPFLLRPVPSQETYEFIGEAYTHGVMQGEALLEKNKNKYPKLVFKLV
jgi:hypothetical protein